MILFLSTRLGKPIPKRLQNITCTHCDPSNTLTSVKQAQYLHVFWIKPFKIHTQRYAECPHCKRVYFEDGFTDHMMTAFNALW